MKKFAVQYRDRPLVVEVEEERIARVYEDEKLIAEISPSVLPSAPQWMVAEMVQSHMLALEKYEAAHSAE